MNTPTDYPEDIELSWADLLIMAASFGSMIVALTLVIAALTG